MKSWSWVLLIVSAILIKWVSLYPGFVERNYSRGVYPVISRVQRFLFGWIPFSIGDLFYAFLILVLLFRTVRFFRLLFQKKINRRYFASALQQFIFFFLFLYVFFNLLWGLNYNRVGIARQLDLQVKPYTLADLDTLTATLESRLTEFTAPGDETRRDSLEKKRRLFAQSQEAYKAVAQTYPFLTYLTPSVKPSLFSYIGNYLGFQGYYNPFSGEAQVNTTIPRFLEPYVTTHEMAHQLGYGKENEANFVGYLACRYYGSPLYRYSVYFDMYNYAVTEIYSRDTALARAFQLKLPDQVKADIKAYREFYRRYKNPFEPVVMWFYGNYLKANNQPAGKETYNEVVAWLIAYYKKFGIDAI